MVLTESSASRRQPQRGQAGSESEPNNSQVFCTPIHTPKELTEFIRIPRKIYAGIPNFVARLDAGERLSLDPRHAPFFRHGAAQYWIARRNGKVAGRISAQIDRLQGGSYGLFGCLDAVDDEDVIRMLIRNAEDWLKERGICSMRGPFSLSINGESGLLTQGHDAGSMIMMPWHPPYLEDHVKAAGLVPVKDLIAYAMDPSEAERALSDRVKVPQLPSSFRVRPLKMNDLEGEARILTDLYNDAWADNWGFVPLTVDEVGALAKAFRIFLVPECGAILEADGIPVAMALILPNLEAITGDFGGTLLPLNWARLLYRAARKEYSSARLVLFGVARRLRGTLVGSAAPFALISEFLRHAQKYHLRELEMSWVLADNLPIRSIINRYGGRETKRYTVFEKSIG